MTPNRSLAAIFALAVGGILLLGSLALGMFPLLGGGEECATNAPAELGEGGFGATVSVSLLPYGASCVFEDSEAGAVFSPGPSPIWTIAIVIGLVLVLRATVALTRSSVSGPRSRKSLIQSSQD